MYVYYKLKKTQKVRNEKCYFLFLRFQFLILKQKTKAKTRVFIPKFHTGQNSKNFSATIQQKAQTKRTAKEVFIPNLNAGQNLKNFSITIQHLNKDQNTS